MFYYKMTGKQEKNKERMIHRHRNEENCIDGALIEILRMTFKLALKTWELLGIKMLSNVLLKPILLRGTMQNSWANLDHHVQRVTDKIIIINMQWTKKYVSSLWWIVFQVRNKTKQQTDSYTSKRVPSKIRLLQEF